MAAYISIFWLMFSSIASAQQAIEAAQIINWARQVGAWTILFFILGGALIVLGIIFGRFWPRARKWVVVLGLIFIFIGVFVVQILYVIPMLGQPTITYQVCDQTFFPSTKPTPVFAVSDVIVDFITMTACVFTGYVPSSLTWLGITTFFIFGIIAPLGVLMALFYEFTDFLANPNVRKVMTFLSALIAFRFLLASMFLEILGYGFAGLGLLLIDFFFFMVAFRAMSGLWKAYEAVEEVVAVEDREMLSYLLRRRDDLMNMIAKTPPGDLLNKLQKDLNDVEKKINDLKSKLKLV